MRRLLLIAACTATWSAGGCVYQHTIRPLTTNFNKTPATVERGRGDTKQLTVSYVNLAWDSNGIGDIARANGFEEVWFADLETLRVMGVWTQQWVHVYGR
ncbi:MAG: hypothetical protein NXI31_14750 [bacterium]|nr:hypothetical protein [bacterium]